MFDYTQFLFQTIKRVLKARKRRLPEHIRNLSDEAWLDLLIKSISVQNIENIEFPGFPPPDLQVRFVGSDYEQALREAFVFYTFVKSHAESLKMPLSPNSRFLDFGCGWGRFLRFFWKDIKEYKLFGCDVNTIILDVCRDTHVPGNLSLISPEGKLPYPNNYFEFVIAYSVFTLLPEKLNLHWMRELARVSRPGCIFCLTIEPRRFIDFIISIPPDTDSEWYRLLSQYANRSDKLYHQYDAGKIAYLPTYGENIGHNFGDAVVPLAFIEKEWSPFFAIKTYVDDPTHFWQAALVLQRTRF
jgi:ubiquinone/menaquinone biosynthesis C-methylase UbiE